MRKCTTPNDFADNVQIDFPAPNAAPERLKPVLLLGHFDTVYPMGTLATMPCRVVNDRMHGPGVLDMKSGIALMLYAIERCKPGTEPCLARSQYFSSPTKKSAATPRAKSPKSSAERIRRRPRARTRRVCAAP